MRKKYLIYVILSLLVILLTTAITINCLNFFKGISKLDKVLVFVSYFSILTIMIILMVTQIKYLNYIKTLENRLSLWNTITYHVKGAGDVAFNELPIGIIIFDNKFNISWSNNEAKDYLKSSLDDLNLENVANAKLLDFVKNGYKDSTTIDIYNDIYEVKFVKNHNVIYLTKITEISELKKKYQDRTPAVGYINVDNLEEALVDLDVQERTDFSGEVIKTIAEWANKYDAFVRTLSESKYLLITDAYHLSLMEKDKFTVLDEIKLIVCHSKTNLITLSIGIMCDDMSMVELSEAASVQIEMAVNRGGDQVVVKRHDDVNFYGAKTDPIRKESKVGERFKYQELENLMASASSIFCIGHTNQDADAFGACIGLYNLGVALGKPTYIILKPDVIDNTVKKVYHDVEKLHPTLFKDIINPHQAIDLKDDNSLLIVADCQAEVNLFVPKEFISKFKHIAVIDHHRKNENGTIENIDYYYCEPGASSSVELIVSLLQFSNQDLMISSLEATWMMLGMVVDTNNFVYRTTATTFEVASQLNRLQANIGLVQEYLKEDINDKKVRNELISNIEHYRNICALAIQKEEDKSIFEPAMLAKVSDELIKLNNVELAISIAHSDEDTIRLSARSLGRFNCQVLMEQLGGGGHLTGAACQIKNKSISEVVESLKQEIDNILLSNEVFTKVILIKKIKNVGDRGTIIDVSFDQAQKWLEQGLVVLATFENLRIFEQEKDEAQAIVESNFKKYRDLKELLESHPIDIYVTMDNDKNIKLTKIIDEIIKYCKEKSDIYIDSVSVEENTTINSYGSYQVNINILQDFTAKTKVNILEKK